MTIHESRRLEVDCQKINLPGDQNSGNIFSLTVCSLVCSWSVPSSGLTYNYILQSSHTSSRVQD